MQNIAAPPLQHDVDIARQAEEAEVAQYLEGRRLLPIARERDKLDGRVRAGVGTPRLKATHDFLYS